MNNKTTKDFYTKGYQDGQRTGVLITVFMIISVILITINIYMIVK